MPRLFVAVDFPEETRKRLGGLIEGGVRGLRVTPVERLHLTLHFIGEGEVGRYVSALENVRGASFELGFGKLGCFSPGKGRRSIWIGLQRSEGLAELHRAVGEALSEVGFVPEARVFAPHVTLARCGGEVPRGEIERMVAAEFEMVPPVRVTEVHLYSSKLGSEGPRYTCERSFALGCRPGR